MPTHKEAKAPVKTMTGQTPQLPLSVEQAYRQKCIDLKKRLAECEDSNELLVVRNQRLRRGIQRLRLERALLLREIEQRIQPRVDDSDGSPSPPPTPNEKPLRAKRPRREPPQNDQSERQDSPTSPGAGEPLPFISNFRSVNNESQAEVASSPPPAAVVRRIAMRTSASGRSGNSRENSKPKPKNAYMLFCDRQRPLLLSAKPDESESDTALQLAKAWQSLGATGQRDFLDEAEKLRLEYDQENPGSHSTDTQAKTKGKSPSSRNAKFSDKDTEAIAVADTTQTEDEGAPSLHQVRDYDDSSAAGNGFTAVNANRSNFL